MTHRVRGHFEGDQQKYRDAQDIKRAAESDPTIRMEKYLIDIGLPKTEVAAIKSKVIERVERAVAAGRNGTAPQFAPSLADVYTPHVSY